MFKTIILCALYNLSDDQVEHQIRDRLSFMRFLGLGLDPDAKTVWLYPDCTATGMSSPPQPSDSPIGTSWCGALVS